MLPLSRMVQAFCDSQGITMGDEASCAELMDQQPPDLISSVYKLLVDKKEFDLVVVHNPKNEDEAELYLNSGVEAFDANEDIMCVYCQTICIATAPSNSPLLPKAYAYRSSSLFRLERYSACLMDANRALREETSPHLTEIMRLGLLERKQICIAVLKTAKLDRYNKEKVMSELASGDADKPKDDKTKQAEKRKEDECSEQPTTSSSSQKKKPKKRKKRAQKEQQMAIDEIDEEITSPDNSGKFPLPIIENPNEMIPCASSKVNISYSKAYGRHLVASDDIKPGELLVVENPFASVLFPQNYAVCCRYCFVRCEALIPCPKCLMGTYCSESCRSKAYDEFHRVECPILPTIIKLQVIGDTHLAFRLLLIATKQGTNLSSMMQHPTYKSPWDISQGPIEGQFLSEDYKNVHNLTDSYRISSFFNLFKKCYEVAVLLFLLKHTTFFGRSEEDKSVVDTETLSDEEIFAGIMLLKYLLLTPHNSRPVADVLETPNVNAVPDEEYYHTCLLGYALYPLHSLMNHSCDPNTQSINHKNSIVCYAIQPISKGEQIFTSYNWVYSRYDKKHRQMHLFETYHFHCKCNACEFEWGTKAAYVTEPKRISNRFKEKDMKQFERKFRAFTSKEGLNSTSQEDSDFLIALISAYHKGVKLPCKTYIEALECFSFLLGKSSNIYENDEDFVLCKLAFVSKNRDPASS